MKILILQDDFPPYEHGGAGVIAGFAADSFVAEGHEVFVITTVDDKERVGKFSENGMTIYRIYSKYHERWRPYISLYNFKVVSQVKRLMKEIKPQVVNAHNIHYHLSYHSLKIARKYTDKVFLTAHDIMTFYQGSFTEYIDKNDLSIKETFNYKVTARMLFRAFKKRYNPFHNVLVKYHLSFVKRIIAVSDALKDALSQNNIHNVVVIKNGINVSKWSIPEQEIDSYRQKVGANDKQIVLFGGRLSGAKGGWLILEAMVKVIKQRPNASLVIFGRGDEYINKVKKKAVSLGIENNIIFGGWNGEDVLRLQYGITDVVVVPSVCFDSFPTVNLQAIASGKPVVATCFGGSREVIKDGVNGFIINPYDLDKMAETIVRLLENKELRETLGSKGKEMALKDYTMDVMGKNYLTLFTE